MRKLVLRLAVFCAIALAVVYAFGNYMDWLWQKYGDPAQVQNNVRIVLLISTLFFAALYLIKKVIVIILILAVVLLLLLIFQFDLLHVLNIIG